MEALVQTRQWRYAREQLEVCEKQMYAAADELDELNRRICKTAENESMQSVRITLQEQMSDLYRQAEVLTDMGTVLEKAWQRYEKCEDRIVQSAETDGRLFEETLATAELSGLAQIRAFLE